MEIAIALGLMDLLKMAIPAIQREVEAGNVPVEKQREVLDTYNNMRASLDTYFTGPEWQVDPDEPTPPTLVTPENTLPFVDSSVTPPEPPTA